MKEGNLQAPTRHPINWQNPDFYNEDSLNNELERVFDLCHGCRRCVSLCDSFPALFDLVDESETMEVDGVDRKDYKKIVDACYLCDLCYMTKCPYTPPHEWNIDFPHLMLRAKATYHKQGQTKLSSKILSSTTTVGKLASFPVVNTVVNAVNNNSLTRKAIQATLNVHKDASLPTYYSKTSRKRLKKVKPLSEFEQKVVLFITCYGEYNSPQSVMDLVDVLRFNKVEVITLEKEKCCGMPKLESGDIETVVEYAQYNIPKLYEYANQGYKIITPIPSCGLMFRQELPLLLPTDEQVAIVSQAMRDPFEYLLELQEQGLLNIDALQPVDKHILYHAACHQRVQNIGSKTKELLSLIPEVTLSTANRCSGHDGTYGVKKDTYESALKICKPITRDIKADTEIICSDCVMAGSHISHTQNVLNNQEVEHMHPISVVKMSYNI